MHVLAQVLAPRSSDRFSGVDLDHNGSTKNLTVNQRYLDPNRVTYEVFHSYYFLP